MSTINGLVAWGNTQNGLRLYGGTKVKIRNGVFLMNGLDAVYLTSYEATAAGNNLAELDLGTTADPGRNYLQGAVGSNPNLAGLCISMSDNMGALTLATRGNLFAGPTDCATSTAAITRSTVCGGYTDLGVIPAAGTTVTVDVGPASNDVATLVPAFPGWGCLFLRLARGRRRPRVRSEATVRV